MGKCGDTGSRRNMANFMTMGNSGSREILLVWRNGRTLGTLGKWGTSRIWGSFGVVNFKNIWSLWADGRNRANYKKKGHWKKVGNI
jgi:hypothetical protein